MNHKLILSLLVTTTLLVPPVAADEERIVARGGDTACSDVVPGCSDGELIGVLVGDCWFIHYDFDNPDNSNYACTVRFQAHVTVQSVGGCGYMTTSVTDSVLTCSILLTPDTKSSEPVEKTYEWVPRLGRVEREEARICIDYLSASQKCPPSFVVNVHLPSWHTGILGLGLWDLLDILPGTIPTTEEIEEAALNAWDSHSSQLPHGFSVGDQRLV